MEHDLTKKVDKLVWEAAKRIGAYANELHAAPPADDLVTRLRAKWTNWILASQAMRAAADEITQLRETVERLERERDEAYTQWEFNAESAVHLQKRATTAEATIARLQAELAAAREVIAAADAMRKGCAHTFHREEESWCATNDYDAARSDVSNQGDRK